MSQFLSNLLTRRQLNISKKTLTNKLKTLAYKNTNKTTVLRTFNLITSSFDIYNRLRNSIRIIRLYNYESFLVNVGGGARSFCNLSSGYWVQAK